MNWKLRFEIAQNTLIFLISFEILKHTIFVLSFLFKRNKRNSYCSTKNCRWMLSESKIGFGFTLVQKWGVVH